LVPYHDKDPLSASSQAAYDEDEEDGLTEKRAINIRLCMDHLFREAIQARHSWSKVVKLFDIADEDSSRADRVAKKLMKVENLSSFFTQLSRSVSNIQFEQHWLTNFLRRAFPGRSFAPVVPSVHMILSALNVFMFYMVDGYVPTNLAHPFAYSPVQWNHDEAMMWSAVRRMGGVSVLRDFSRDFILRGMTLMSDDEIDEHRFPCVLRSAATYLFVLKMCLSDHADRKRQGETLQFHVKQARTEQD
jgi:hypothetical protein